MGSFVFLFLFLCVLCLPKPRRVAFCNDEKNPFIVERSLTPLHVASMAGHASVVRLLLKAGVKTELTDVADLCALTLTSSIIDRFTRIVFFVVV